MIMVFLAKTAKASDPGEPKATTLLRQVVGHVAMTERLGAAWYRLPGVPWSFRPDRDREAHIVNHAVVLAQLTGRHIQLRGTTTPFPVQSWAEQHHAMVVAKGKPYGATPLAGTWEDLLEGEQALFLDEHQSEKEVFIGVDFLRRSMLANYASAAFPKRMGPLSRELSRQHVKLSTLDTLMARAGMNGRPATAQQMAWLLLRSSALGFPAPAKRLALEVDEWGTGDLADLLKQATWAVHPFGSTLRVTSIMNGHPMTRHVAILTVGRMQKMEIPQAAPPWMTIPDALGIPLEWSGHFTPRANKDVLAEMRLLLGKIASQTRHYEQEHDMDAPAALEEQRALALQVEKELTDLSDSSLGRAKGWWRIAVSGRTEQECLEHAESVIETFGRTIEVKHTFGQYDLAREFLPGSTVKLTAHERKLPLRAIAAGGAAVTSMAGDRRGWNLARSSLDNSPVMFDFWRNMEDYDVSGLYLLISALGGGKTTVLGAAVAKTGAAGIPWCVIDPAGRLGRLGRTAQLRKVSRSIDLLNGAPGSLNPYALVREPTMDDFKTIDLVELDDADVELLGLHIDDLHTAKLSDLDPARVQQLRERRFQRAVNRAAAIRTRLCIDSLTQILPTNVAVTGEDAGHVTTELRLAAGLVAAPNGPFKGRPRHPGQIIQALRQSKTAHQSVAYATADLLESIAREPQPSLLFPETDEDAESTDAFEAQLTFLSTKGLVLPEPDVRQEFWQDEPRQGVAILNLTSWKALRWMYALPADQRKGVGLDEIQFLNAVPSGRLMLTEFARNTRKQNCAVLAAGQDPGDTLLDTRGGNNFVGGAFLGRMDDLEAASRALRIAQIPVGVGYEQSLLDLPRPDDDHPDMPRQFLFYNRGGTGFKEIITISRAGRHTEWIWNALESSPSQQFTGSAV